MLNALRSAATAVAVLAIGGEALATQPEAQPPKLVTHTELLSKEEFLACYPEPWERETALKSDQRLRATAAEFPPDRIARINAGERQRAEACRERIPLPDEATTPMPAGIDPILGVVVEPPWSFLHEQKGDDAGGLAFIGEARKDPEGYISVPLRMEWRPSPTGPRSTKSMKAWLLLKCDQKLYAWGFQLFYRQHNLRDGIPPSLAKEDYPGLKWQPFPTGENVVASAVKRTCASPGQAG